MAAFGRGGSELGLFKIRSLLMRNRLFKALGLVMVGCSFQFAGCNSQELANILIDSARNTTVEVVTFAVESTFDQALGLDE
jgi:hypothetical protein